LKPWIPGLRAPFPPPPGFGKEKQMAAGTNIADQIITALAEYLKRDKKTIALDNRLRDDLGLDSIATIELLFKLEEVFDLQIPDEDLKGLVTVGHVVKYVQKRLAPAPSKKGPGKPAKTKLPKK
jgi:acyl carrier protein